ncbi:hypothetical protein [Actinomadura rubrisoli]|uniref:Tat pathway signal sequence domain protein n=1 Tax=Actinomadura rubrisoli TaxID=2530368 RepID=A0A4R4ZLI4_9ACTN|nr:hypothetical protein [Actinomadura rubrisoli]TDD59681.1 hypothetical protein E1298_46495 [Actinomadura rubrisoli]
MPQRLRRLGSASAAVSAGALVLVLGAPSADAAASGRPCKKGTDPASTIENWKCNLGNLRDAINPPKSPAPKPAPKPAKHTKKTSPKKNAGGGKSTSPSRGSRAPSGTPGGGGGSGGAPATMTGAGGLQPYKGTAPSGLPGVLPSPEVAADPNGYLPQSGTAPVPQTRLISPVAASQHQGGQTAWVAAAAGAAGAVAALNISVVGRGLRRRAAR